MSDCQLESSTWSCPRLCGPDDSYYWSFPSAESTKAINTLAAKEMSQAALQLELRTAQEEIAALRVGREDNEERRTMLRQIKEAERALGGLEKTQAQFSTCDPVFYARKGASDVVCSWTLADYVDR